MGLSATDRERLVRLAALAGVTIEAIWSDVWLYGFDETEESVRAGIEADADIAAGRLIPHEDVMAEAWRIVNRTSQTKQES